MVSFSYWNHIGNNARFSLFSPSSPSYSQFRTSNSTFSLSSSFSLHFINSFFVNFAKSLILISILSFLLYTNFILIFNFTFSSSSFSYATFYCYLILDHSQTKKNLTQNITSSPCHFSYPKLRNIKMLICFYFML